MATEKLDFSLRLRHDRKSLSNIAQQIGLSARVAWDIGEQNKRLDGKLSPGVRDNSYRTYDLGDETSTGDEAGVDLDDAISKYLHKLEPLKSTIRSLVKSGGTASLAIGWFCDSAIGGDQISSETLRKMADLRLTLDLYLYMSVPTSAEGHSAEEGR